MRARIVWSLPFAVVFLLGVDVWSWGRAEPLILGLPYWVIYLFGLTVGLSGLFALFAWSRWRD